MNVNMNRIETLEELIESYKKCPYKVETYEFDGTGYALLIIEINKMLKENQKLKGSLQTHEILLRANVEENQQLKQQLQQKEDIINSIKEYVKHTEYFYTKGRLQCVDYKINGFKILELIDNKGE